jgi:hypothetical protein
MMRANALARASSSMSTAIRTSYAQPALIGGVVMGVLSALPVVAAGNLCCCLWIISGGAVAAYVLQQNQSSPITPADGALVGLLAGLIGAVVQFVIAIPVGLLVAPLERAMLQRVMEMAGSMPPEMREALERYTGASGEFSIGLLIIRKLAELIMWLFIGGIFSTLGGLIGAMMFRKQPPPLQSPGVIDVPPTA